MLDIFLDVVVDTLKLIPFLFATYLFMEWLEERAQGGSVALIRRADRTGPIIGALLGVVPQCGFSAVASSLYSGGVITAGTLLAVFLSTSDEMLPVFLSEAVPIATIGKVLLIKALFGICGGYLVMVLFRLLKRRTDSGREIHDLCEQEHCHCEEGSILKSALIHTAQVTAFIFIISLAAAILIGLAGEARVASLMNNRPIAGTFLSALVGMIPNCAASVMITELYIKGLLTAGQMMAGLLSGSGMGLLVLFRTNKNLKDNLALAAAVYVLGVCGGLLLTLFRVAL